MRNPSVDREGDTFIVFLASEREDIDMTIRLSWGQANALHVALGQMMLDWDAEFAPESIFGGAF